MQEVRDAVRCCAEADIVKKKELTILGGGVGGEEDKTKLDGNVGNVTAVSLMKILFDVG